MRLRKVDTIGRSEVNHLNHQNVEVMSRDAVESVRTEQSHSMNEVIDISEWNNSHAKGQ